jgi:hypothetical protein
VYDFGLTTEQFYLLTPAKFNALSRRFDAEQERADYQTARLTWAAFTAMGVTKKGGGSFELKDFLLRHEDGADDDLDPSEQITSTFIGNFGLPPHMEWMRRGRQ